MLRYNYFQKQPPEVFYEKAVKKETPTQVFSYEYCKNFKDTCFEEHLRTTVFDFANGVFNETEVQGLLSHL